MPASLVRTPRACRGVERFVQACVHESLRHRLLQRAPRHDRRDLHPAVDLLLEMALRPTDRRPVGGSVPHRSDAVAPSRALSPAASAAHAAQKSTPTHIMT